MQKKPNKMVLPVEVDVITTCKMREMVNRGCRGCDISEGMCNQVCISFKVNKPCDIDYYENEEDF